MTHYIRRRNRIIVDCEAMKDDLSVVVCLDEYSQFLLDTRERDRNELILDFHEVQELRGEYFEIHKMDESPDDLAARRLKELACKYELEYVTD